jgi:hypothetical protein
MKLQKSSLPGTPRFSAEVAMQTAGRECFHHTFDLLTTLEACQSTDIAF